MIRKAQNSKSTFVILTIAMLCYALPVYAQDYTLRVHIDGDYDEFDEAMLLKMSIPELIEKIYPDYKDYITLLSKLYTSFEDSKEISKVDIEEYLKLRNKLGKMLNLWNTKVVDSWEQSGEWGSLAKNAEGARLFREWKEKAVHEWLEGQEDLGFQLGRLHGKYLKFGQHTLTNHFDVFIKAEDTEDFISTEHIHQDLYMIDLFTLVGLKGNTVHILLGELSTNRERDKKGLYDYYIKEYYKEDRIMQIDNNGLFSIPAVDEYIAKQMGVTSINDLLQKQTDI